MKNPLKEAQEVLDDLEKELATGRLLWETASTSGPDWDQFLQKSWATKHAKCCLHGATDILEANELERWLFDNPPLSETAKSSAIHNVKCWREWLEMKDAYYEPFEDFEFDEPQEGESLFNFILRMAKTVEEEGPGARLEWRAFKSFLAYLRKISLEEVAFIEQIFPQKMDIYHGKIIRIISLETPAIPQETAAEIIMELARECRGGGRRDAQHTTAECLGLCWLCLTASRLRLPIHLINTLMTIKSSALQLNGEFPVLLVPTFFGDRPIRISGRVGKFLHVLSRIPSKKPRETILQRSFRSLSQRFEAALKKVAPNPKFGNITFVSLLSPPHQFGAYRYQDK